ncbi:hypothetical protein F5Y14DRAFT_452152 [Nemania sp. NC0429]|nr:hypothetical protein F5Y14DRAFT_452152 [Nemania sp. NC0429]
MQGDANSTGEVSRLSPPSPRAEHASTIRSARESDVEAIVAIETASFPQVYGDAGDLANCRRRDIEQGYPCYRVLAASSRQGEQTTIYGFITVESYLRSHGEYRDPQSGEGIALPANCLADKQPAYSILMAAARADPALLDDEFLFVSEICIHPRGRQTGNGTRLMRHIVEVAGVLAVKVIVLVEGSVSDAAKRWAVDEGEQVNPGELSGLREREERTMMPFYEDKLGFVRRSYFFWGRRGSGIPRIFHVMQYPAYN